MVFKSKISWGLWILVFIVLAVTSGLMLRDGVWEPIIVNLLVAFLVIHLITNTTYEIQGTTLMIRCGFLYKKQLEISRIRKITSTNNPLSAPAASLDRLSIMYDKWSTVLISPEDQELFVAQVLRINPNIEVRLKKQVG
jgi:hypothetical protein